MPKTNKRFLHQIIRNVDDHNTAVLHAQAQAAEDARAQREEAERAERRARAIEASQHRLRRLMGGASRRSREGGDTSESLYSSRRRRSTSRDRTDRRVRDYSDYDDRDRDRSYKQSYRKRRREDEDDHYYQPSRSSRNHSSSRVSPAVRDEERLARHHSPEHGSRVGSSGRRARSPPTTREHGVNELIDRQSPEDGMTHAETVTRNRKRENSTSSSSSLSSYERSHRSKRRRSRSESPLARSRERTPSRSESPIHPAANDGDERWPHKSSRHLERDSKKRSKHGHRLEWEAEKKKKKHKTVPGSNNHEVDTPPVHSSKMDKYFDPAYDPALDYTPVLDTNSMVQEGAFASWNTMLQLIRIRREDKEAKKRREKEGESRSSSSSKRPVGEPGLMDIMYKKRGSVREWDLGKD